MTDMEITAMALAQLLQEDAGLTLFRNRLASDEEAVLIATAYSPLDVVEEIKDDVALSKASDALGKPLDVMRCLCGMGFSNKDEGGLYTEYRSFVPHGLITALSTSWAYVCRNPDLKVWASYQAPGYRTPEWCKARRSEAVYAVSFAFFKALEKKWLRETGGDGYEAKDDEARAIVRAVGASDDEALKALEGLKLSEVSESYVLSSCCYGLPRVDVEASNRFKQSDGHADQFVAEVLRSMGFIVRDFGDGMAIRDHSQNFRLIEGAWKNVSDDFAFERVFSFQKSRR